MAPSSRLREPVCSAAAQYMDPGILAREGAALAHDAGLED